MKKLMAVGCALMSAFAVFAEGEDPYPEYDFYLTAKDSNTDNSWNKTGHWSGEWPEDAVNKTFYVPADKTLCSYGVASAYAGLWQGGTLTVAGNMTHLPKAVQVTAQASRILSSWTIRSSAEVPTVFFWIVPSPT